MGLLTEETLNVNNYEVRQLINKEFERRIKPAKARAMKETNELRKGINFYRTSPANAIFDSIDKSAEEKFDNMSDEEALKRGLFQAVAEAYDREKFFPNLFKKKRLRVIRERINEMMGTLDDEAKTRVIANYKVNNKAKYIEIEQKKCLSDAELFQNMSMEELNHYVELWEEALKRNHLNKARLAAVHAVAKAEGVKVPLSLRDETSKEAVEDEVNNIVDEMLITEENKKLRSKILAKTKAVAKATFSNANVTAMSATIATVGGMAAGAFSNINIAEGSLFPVMAGTSALLFAVASASYYAVGRKDDKQAIDEYQKMGLIVTMSDAEVTKRELMDFDKQMRDKYDILIIEDGGNNNGLHR